MIDLAAALAEIVDRPVEGRGAAGLAVLVAGAADPVAAWTPTSRDEPAYLAYSITKTFTAVLFLLLRDEGRLALDDRLARWFPAIPGADRISLRQLLNHTAGIPDYGGLPAYHEAVRGFPSTPWSFERFAAETFDKGLRFEPGTGWAYSNPGYMLLKRVAEEVAGAPYATLIGEQIVGPLGLRRTFVPDSLDALSSLAPASSRELTADGSPCDVRGRYHPGWVSHGVVASTASDIARFFHALFGGRIISSHSLREMQTAVPVAGAPPMPSPRWSAPGYGLGIVGIAESPFGPLWGHNGGGPGYRTSAYHAPELGEASVCAMCALEGDPGAEPLVLAVFAALRGRDSP
ncbi:MAG TPA: serine hydrolase domain-containing protein [Methylomirabilota bacterium]|nr:serine hydrolase domain-containing protein [Methylomirabilota bacterium]